MDKNNNSEVMVSVCCMAYNHEEYISQTINSFLSQRANFNFEIVIHDDASSDETTNIIKKYYNEYSDIIKPIFQKENQYSKGKKIFPFLSSYASGKYIALCEGDDYWTVPNKLQKQVEYMQENPECSLCFHASCVKQNEITSSYYRAASENTTFSLKEMLYYNGTMFHTISMLFRTEHVTSLPSYYYDAPVGDLPLKIHLAMKGNLYYIDEVMSVYRSQIDGSWSSKNMLKNEAKKTHCKKMCKMLDDINEYTRFEFTDILNYRKGYYEFTQLLIDADYKKIISKKYSQ
jgi:glycosyltransferase involved in cell wall biosynthesis